MKHEYTVKTDIYIYIYIDLLYMFLAAYPDEFVHARG